MDQKFTSNGVLVKLLIKNSHQMGHMVKLLINNSHQIGYMVQLLIENSHQMGIWSNYGSKFTSNGVYG